jgi:SPP1 gp7 family putative phage head morphogenesis protein
MKIPEYRRERFAAIEADMNRAARITAVDFERHVTVIQQEFDGQIARWYQRFADNNEIDLVEARRRLTAGELAEFRWNVDEYIRHARENTTSGEWEKQLENASIRVHVSRLEALQLNVRYVCERLFGAQLDTMNELARSQFTETYSRCMFEFQRAFGIGWNVRIDERTLQTLIDKPWTTDNLTFSDRIWRDKDRLVAELERTLTQSIMLGRNPNELAADFAGKFETSKSNAARLLMTESAYMSSAAEFQSYKDAGVEQYQVLATLDLRTSDICQSMDGRVFAVSEYVPGLNAPPFHPWCRTTTVPHFDDEHSELFAGGSRTARDVKTGKTIRVPADMTYSQWREKFVKSPADGQSPPHRDSSLQKFISEGLTNASNGGIMGLGGGIMVKQNDFIQDVISRIGTEFPLTLNAGHQDKHIEGSPNFDPTRSTLTADAEELIRLYAGKSYPVIPKPGKPWNQRERFTHIEIIGIYRDMAGNELPTMNGVIHYTKQKGAHVVPARPEGRY